MKQRALARGGGVATSAIQVLATALVLFASAAVADWWSLGAGYSYLRKKLEVQPGSRDIFGPLFAGNDPGHQVSLRSAMSLPGKIEFDAEVLSIGTLPSPAVAAYIALDVRQSWRVSDHVELALVGTILSDPIHPEFVNPSTPRREVRRGVYGSVRWRH